MSTSKVRSHLILLLAAVALCPALRPQSTLGTVLGVVKESSGSIVQSAMVKLTNTGTNAERSTLSDQTGTFQFVNVDVGTYKLAVEGVGFQKGGVSVV